MSSARLEFLFDLSTLFLFLISDSKTDFMSHFKLIEQNRYEMYSKAFAKVDKQGKGHIPVEVIVTSSNFSDVSDDFSYASDPLVVPSLL